MTPNSNDARPLVDTAGDVRGLERFMTEIALVFADPIAAHA